VTEQVITRGASGEREEEDALEGLEQGEDSLLTHTKAARYSELSRGRGLMMDFVVVMEETD